MLLGILGIPLLSSSLGSDPSYFAQHLGLGVILLAGIYAYGFRKEKSAILLPPWGLMVAFGLLLGLSLLSTQWSLVPAEAWQSVVEWNSYLLFFFLLYQMVHGETRFYVLFMLTLMLLILSGIGLAQRATGDALGFPGGTTFPYASQGNANILAEIMVMGLPAVGYFSYTNTRISRWLGMVTLASILSVVVVSGSRAASAGVLLMVIVVVLAGAWKLVKAKPDRWKWAIPASLACLMLVGFWNMHVNRNKAGSFEFHLLTDPEARIQPETNSLEFRYILWNHSWDMGLDHFPWGVGAGNWKMHAQDYGIIGYDDQGRFGMDIVRRPHNEFVGKWAELGPLGLLALLGVFAMGMWGAWRQVSSSEQDKAILGWLLLGCWLGMLVIFSFGFPLERPTQGMLWMFALALSLPPQRRVDRSSRPLLVLLIPCLLACIFLFDRWSRDIYYLELERYKVENNTEMTFIVLHRTSFVYMPVSPTQGVPASWYEGMAYFSTPQAGLAQWKQGLNAMERAYIEAPHQWAVRSNLAAAYEMTGASEQARNLYLDLVEDFPGDEEAWLNLSVVHLHLGELAQARQVLSHVRQVRFAERVAAIDAELKRLGF